MSSPPTDARIVRSGTALELSGAGRSWIVRRVDLDDRLGRAQPASSPRFQEVALMGDELHLRMSDDSIERLSLREPPFRSSPNPDTIVHNTAALMTCDAGRSDGDPLALIRDGAVVLAGDRVLWCGPNDQLADCGLNLGDCRDLDAGGRLVTPGLVDCHTHPVFAGNRAEEFARRARGESYQDIAAEGGGIQATVNATRAASHAELVALTAARVTDALHWGTTTMEAKSGYDLTLEGELRLLQIALEVDALQPVDLMPTLLGAHAVPPEYRDRRQDYVDLVAGEMVARAAREGLARAVDVYCDEGAFSLAETRQILESARRHRLPVKAHIGQFADLGAAQLLAHLAALSGDHVENISDDGIAVMAACSVVAVMLPGACVQLRMSPPPVARLRAAGVALAVASDLNPGTSNSQSLPLAMWLAITHLGMTVEETWLGVTRVAAQALGRADVGHLTAGARADLVLWDAEHPAEVPYRFGIRLVHQVIKDGRLVVGDH